MKIILTDVGKVMERGQVTLPVQMRRKLGLKPGSLVSIKFTDTHALIIEPLEKTNSSLADVLEDLATDNIDYWNSEKKL